MNSNIPSFPSLPEIPSCKWIGKTSSPRTDEQRVLSNIFKNHKPNSDDLHIIKELTEFYRNLQKGLSKINYEIFTQDDIVAFQNYIRYVYYYTFQIQPQSFQINIIYRVVKNEHIINERSHLTKKSFLSYPPIEIVNLLGRFNRGNSPNYTLFYGSETIDTALNEIKPKIGDLVSVGIWQPKNNRNFSPHIIFNSANDIAFNETANNAGNHYNSIINNSPSFMTDFLTQYFELLSYEFSKHVTSDKAYLLSSILSEDTLNLQNNSLKNNTCDLIVFPSVGNKFLTNNLAIRPDIFDESFNLTKVVEFEVKDTHYNLPRPKKNQSYNHNYITVLVPKNVKETVNIDEENIIWN